MASLADAHVDAQARLRAIVVRTVQQIWGDLPGHDRQNVDEWLSKVLPVVLTAQRTSVALTEAFIAHSLGRRPVGVDPSMLVGAAVRGGVPPEEVYTRPFVTLWTALGDGSQWADANALGLNRAESTAAMDVQLSMRSTSQAVQDTGGIYGYRRVANAGACRFCVSLNGAYVKDASAAAMHPRCGCGLEPLTEPHPRASRLPSGVRVEQHGELGALVTDPHQHFTEL